MKRSAATTLVLFLTLLAGCAQSAPRADVTPIAPPAAAGGGGGGGGGGY